MLTKKTSKNQITLPKAIADHFPDAQYFDARIEDDKILMIPVKFSPSGPPLASIREKMRRLGITGKDVSEAIRWARRKKK